MYTHCFLWNTGAVYLLWLLLNNSRAAHEQRSTRFTGFNESRLIDRNNYTFLRHMYFHSTREWSDNRFTFRWKSIRVDSLCVCAVLCSAAVTYMRGSDCSLSERTRQEFCVGREEKRRRWKVERHSLTYPNDIVIVFYYFLLTLLSLHPHFYFNVSRTRSSSPLSLPLSTRQSVFIRFFLSRSDWSCLFLFFSLLSCPTKLHWIVCASTSYEQKFHQTLHSHWNAKNPKQSRRGTQLCR